MTAKLMYATAGSRNEAEEIASTLVQDKLAACVNIIGPSTSIYRWNDEVQQDDEFVLIIKTKAQMVEQVLDKIRNLHSYDCPAISVIDIENGNPDFLKWILDNTI